MKRNILSLTVMLFCGILYAQEDTKNVIVSVENDYNPTVVTVNKKNFTPTVEGKSNAVPSELVFSKQATPYTGFTSERDSKDLLPMQEKALPGYLRLGYGVRNDIDAKLAYNLNLGKKSYLRVLGAFDGFKCDVKEAESEWNSRMYNTAAAADFAYNFKKLIFNVNGDFNNRVFNYRKATGFNGALDRQHHFNYNVGMNGISQLVGPMSYTFNVAYSHSLISYNGGVEKPFTEDYINAGTVIAHEIYRKYLRSAGIEVDFNGFIYNGNGYKNLLSMDFNPFVNYNFNDWKIKFGAKFNFRTANGPVFAAAPNITVDKALTKRISFYANVTGGRKDYCFKAIENITPYWGVFDKQIKPTYRIVDLVAGTRLTLEPLSFDVYAGYVLTKDDLLQYVDDEQMSQSQFVYSCFAQELTNNVHVGARVGYDCGGWLNVAADARYDYWTCDNKDYLMLRPEFTANAKIELFPIRNMTVKLGYNYTHYTKGIANDKHDLHARISYVVNRYVGAFLQGDNLLNGKYYEYAGYYTRGIRGMLGVTVNF